MLKNNMKNFLLLIKWQALRMKITLPFLCVLQIVIGVGASFGLGFIMPRSIDSSELLYSITGIPIITMLMVGLSLFPQIVSDDIDKGIFDYIWSLPLSRITFFISDVTVWVLSALPGFILSLVTSSLHYNFKFRIHVSVVSCFLLVMCTTCFIGYTIAHLLKNSQFVLLITSFILFSLFLFSPVIYPITRLPKWMVYLHEILPIKHMSDLIRGSISDFHFNFAKSLIVVSIWTVICLFIIYFKVLKIKTK